MSSHTYIGHTGKGYDDTIGIHLGNTIFSVTCEGNNVTFIEECDGWFRDTMSKNEAITALKEVIKYIEQQIPASTSTPTNQ